VVLALAGAAPVGAQTPDRLPDVTPLRADALTQALRRGEIGTPRYALERATSVFHLGAVRARYGAVQRPDPRAATPILRDLTLRLNELSPADEERARRLLARPTDGAADPEGNGYTVAEATPRCRPDFCIHYVPSTVDAPPPRDANDDGVPDWVIRVRDLVRNVWRRETGALRYREPRSDSTSPNNGGDGRLDVYLANLGDDRIYGYCTTDDPKADNPIATTFDVSAYCVIDDDFREPIFSQHSPLDNTRVTVAHEFFHAVQAAYDWKEDLWLFEGTAAWVEDEVYDAINDNRQYLARSPLTASFVPLDLGANGFQYGSWIYFRRLSERFGNRIVRSVWNRADASASGLDDYSVQAISRALSGRGTSFRAAFNDFSRANRRARLVYDEGRAYPARPAALRMWTLTRARRTRDGAAALYQLGAETIVFKPGRGIGRRSKLELELNLPSASRGSEAAVLRFRPSGKLIESRRVNLNRAGDKTLRVRFGRRTVGRVELVLVNASTRYRCGLGLPGTCQGLPRDDRRTYRFRARAIA
jgi:hypothetical protein